MKTQYELVALRDTFMSTTAKWNIEAGIAGMQYLTKGKAYPVYRITRGIFNPGRLFTITDDLGQYLTVLEGAELKRDFRLRKIPHAKPFRLHDHRATLEATERATKANQSAVAAFEGVDHE